MTSGHHPDDSSPRAIIPAGPTLPALRGPGALLTRNVAVSVVAGAVGTFALKKLVELVTEDLYGRVKTLLRREPDRPRRMRRRHEQAPAAPEILPAPEAPGGRLLFVRMVQVTRWIAPGHAQTTVALSAVEPAPPIEAEE